jgi:hypothetical protein
MPLEPDNFGMVMQIHLPLNLADYIVVGDPVFQISLASWHMTYFLCDYPGHNAMQDE